MKTIVTMCGMHLVVAKLIGAGENPGSIRCEFSHHLASGDRSLCVDFGAGYYIRQGEEFICTARDIECAKRWIIEGTVG